MNNHSLNATVHVLNIPKKKIKKLQGWTLEQGKQEVKVVSANEWVGFEFLIIKYLNFVKIAFVVRGEKVNWVAK